MGRRSGLGGAHPAGPNNQNDQNDQHNPNGPNGLNGPNRRRTGRGDKTTLTIAPDVLNEAKDGYWLAMQAGRHLTFAEYVTAALEAYNTAMRDELTNGKPFPQRPTVNLPTSRLT